MPPRKATAMVETRAHLHNGICRQCWGTGMVPEGMAGDKTLCRDCQGEGALP